MLEAAANSDDLQSLPDNRLGALADREGRHSIRINDVSVSCGPATEDVGIVEYHWRESS